MGVTVEGAAKWKARVLDDPDEPQLKYRCPTCKTLRTINLQPLPWSVPADESLVDDDDGGRVLNEDRRRAGSIRHEPQPTVAFQLWCHNCKQGAEITLTQE